MNDNSPLATDILRGADAIAEFLGFGRRTIYHLNANGTLPTFRMGGIVCARKSILIAWIAAQETAATRGAAASTGRPAFAADNDDQPHVLRKRHA
jgi:excisionase family DNA binding protein